MLLFQSKHKQYQLEFEFDSLFTFSVLITFLINFINRSISFTFAISAIVVKSSSKSKEIER